MPCKQRKSARTRAPAGHGLGQQQHGSSSRLGPSPPPRTGLSNPGVSLIISLSRRSYGSYGGMPGASTSLGRGATYLVATRSHAPRLNERTMHLLRMSAATWAHTHWAAIRSTAAAYHNHSAAVGLAPSLTATSLCTSVGS